MKWKIQKLDCMVVSREWTWRDCQDKENINIKGKPGKVK